MKKLILLLFIISIVACEQEPKDYVTFSGKITNQNSDSLIVRNRTFTKTIKVKEDGTFSDTLKVEFGMYSFYDGNEQSSLYLKNGYDLNLTLDTKEFDETIKYSGNGSETNNYLASKSLMQENLFPPSLFDLDEKSFNTKVSEIENKLSTFLENNKNIDSTLYAQEKEELSKFNKGITGAYKQQKSSALARASQFEHLVGNPSPSFDNYENYKGGTTSLSDLKGKYVYVDVWATWCGPCKREFPFQKEIEKAYHGKNIEFVSISVDDGRGFKNDMAAAKEGWKKMIADKKLGGTQLISDKAWKSVFIQGYKINGIPRFILIDPDGNVVNADAPRPSSPKLKELFNSLDI